MKTDSDKADMKQSAPADSIRHSVDGTAVGIDAEAITFEDLFDLEEIQRLQDFLAEATGVACQILRPDTTFITERSNYCRLCGDIIRGNEKGLAKCNESDTSLGELNLDGPNIYHCRSAGFLEAGAPICVGGQHIATWGLGQVCDGTQTEAGIRAYAREIGADEDAAADAFREVTVMSRERFEKVGRMMHAIANQLAGIGYQNIQQTRLMAECKATEEALRKNEERYRETVAGIADIVAVTDAEGVIKDITPNIEAFLGYASGEMIGRHFSQFVSTDDKEIAETGFKAQIGGDRTPAEFRFRTKAGEPRWFSALGRLNKETGNFYTVVRDITERVRTKEELLQFEWLLDKEGDGRGSRHDDYVPPYPDVTELNTSRVILDAVGGKLLKNMASDLMDLLDTSVAVYESNGDYAFGLFASDWCQMADAASFALCGTDDTKTALKSGKWLCHECCWNESARAAIASGEPTDIACVGGIRLYAVPIRAGEDIVGAINIGYGTPPRKDARLRELAERFGVEPDGLRRVSTQYRPRPQYIIDVAKRRCRSLAHHIGEIIERKTAEAAVRSAHDRLEVAVAGGGLGAWEWVVPTGETVINDRWQTMLGFEPGEVGRRLECAHELTDPEALPRLHKLMRAHLDGETPYYEAVYRMRHKSGKWVWIHDRGQVTERNSDGEPLRVCGTHADVTPLMEAEEELRKSEEKYRLLVENQTDLLVKVDREGRFNFVSPSYCRMFGKTEDDLLGKTFTPLVHSDDRKPTEMEMQKLSQPPYTAYIEQRAMTKDGWKWLAWVDTAILDDQGNVKEIIGLGRDISEKKRAEVERQKLQDQLLQAQKMESVGRLAGGVAHDFNNKLTVMMGNAQLLMQDLDRSMPLYEGLQEILDAGNQSTDIVRQLLAFARKQTISPKVLDLNDTIEGMLKMLRRLIGENIKLSWEPGVHLWQVNMDPSQIDQILANLCVNARDAIRSVGMVTIETENAVLDETYCDQHAEFVPGEYVKLAVSDDGSGMNEETLSTIFEPFFTTKEVGKGTGLGLSTVYGAVKQNNGFINAYSEPDKGTSLTIYLPRHRGDVDTGEEATDTELLEGRGETVLIVEDEEMVLKLGKRLLEKLGYTVLASQNPFEAVEMVRRYDGPIHLLMTDVIMPEMSGKDLAKQIKGIRGEMKTLFMSGYPTSAISHHGILEKGVHFIQKPFSMQDLSVKVREALDKDIG